MPLKCRLTQLLTLGQVGVSAPALITFNSNSQEAFVNIRKLMPVKQFNPLLIAKTAPGWREAISSFLPMYGIFLVAAIAQRFIIATPLYDNIIVVAIVRAIMTMLTAYVLLAPVCCGLIFRLRAGNGLKATLLAAILYYPIFVLASSVYFAANATDLLSSEVSFDQLRGIGIFPLGMALIACAFVTLEYRFAKKPDLTATPAKRAYPPYDIGVSVLSAIALYALFFM